MDLSKIYKKDEIYKRLGELKYIPGRKYYICFSFVKVLDYELNISANYYYNNGKLKEFEHTEKNIIKLPSDLKIYDCDEFNVKIYYKPENLVQKIPDNTFKGTQWESFYNMYSGFTKLTLDQVCNLIKHFNKIDKLKFFE